MEWGHHGLHCSISPNGGRDCRQPSSTENWIHVSNIYNDFHFLTKIFTIVQKMEQHPYFYPKLRTQNKVLSLPATATETVEIGFSGKAPVQYFSQKANFHCWDCSCLHLNEGGTSREEIFSPGKLKRREKSIANRQAS